MGDTDGYERFREDAVGRFAGATCPAADRILKICLLTPADKRFLGTLRAVAADTAKSFAEADQGGDIFRAAWESVSLALWEYRQGGARVGRVGRRGSLASPEKNAPRAATARAILAMSFFRQGRAEEASPGSRPGRKSPKAVQKAALTTAPRSRASGSTGSLRESWFARRGPLSTRTALDFRPFPSGWADLSGGFGPGKSHGQ